MSTFKSPVRFFSMCPASISSSPHVNGVTLNASDKLVFGYLYSFCVTTESWKVYPPIDLIAASLNMCEKTARNSIKALERSGLISVERERGKGNIYTIDVTLLNRLEHSLTERLENYRQTSSEKKAQRLKPQNTIIKETPPKAELPANPPPVKPQIKTPPLVTPVKTPTISLDELSGGWMCGEIPDEDAIAESFKPSPENINLSNVNPWGEWEEDRSITKDLNWLLVDETPKYASSPNPWQ